MLHFASRNCLLGRISRTASLERQPRTMLRRAIPSFTVEVQRRPRLATTSNPDVQSSETKPPQAAFDRASDRAAAAAFGANMDSSPVDVAPSPPRGRILPSLVPDEPRHRLLEYAPIPAKDSEPPSRERQSDRPCRSRSERLKHPNRRATRASRLRSMRRRLRDRRPSLSECPGYNQMKGQALRQRSRCVRQVKLSTTPEVSR